MLTFIAIFLAIAALYFARQVLIPLALAVLFTFLLTPLVARLEGWWLGRVPSTLLVLAVCFVATGAVSWRAAGELREISGQFPGYKENIQKKIKLLRGLGSGGFSSATATLRELDKEFSTPTLAETPPTPPSLKGTQKAGTPSAGQPIAVEVVEPPSNAIQYLRIYFGPLVGPLETAGIVVIFTFFMLIKREDLRNRLIRLVGHEQINVMTGALDDIAQRLSRYLLLQFLVNVGYGFLFGLGLYCIGVPHALLWGVLGGLLRFVPYVGTLIGALFPMALALAVFPGWTQAILAFSLFLVIELTLFNFIEPWLYGTHTGISSLAILVAAVFWGLLWGPVGLILSVPLTVCLMLLGQYVPQLKFIEVALGDEPVLAPEVQFYQRLLAMDQEEARDIAGAYLKENPLGNFYDAVLIPALGLAESDRHRDALDEHRRAFLCQSTKELIEELGESTENETRSTASDAEPSADPSSSGLDILCLPARDEADEIVAMMLAQLLQRAGYRAESLAIGAVTDMLEHISRQDVRIACVSALPPFALGQARSLCRQLHSRFPKLKIILGVWNFEGGATKVQERLGTACTDMIGTTLAEVMGQIRQLAEPSPPLIDTSDACLVEKE